jgi:predicted nucleic acid-binding protein
MLVADTNVLIELFLPGPNAEAVEQWWIGDPDWRLPSLWIFEFRHVQLKYLRAGRLSLCDALNDLADAEREFLPKTMPIASSDALRLAHQHGCSSYDAEFVVLAQQMQCPLLTFDRKLLQLFPDVAVNPGS